MGGGCGCVRACACVCVCVCVCVRMCVSSGCGGGGGVYKGRVTHIPERPIFPGNLFKLQPDFDLPFQSGRHLDPPRHASRGKPNCVATAVHAQLESLQWLRSQGPPYVIGHGVS